MYYQVKTGEMEDNLLRDLSNGIYLTINEQEELRNYGDIYIGNKKIIRRNISKHFNKKIKDIVISSDNSMVYVDRNEELHIYCIWCVKDKTVEMKIGKDTGYSLIGENNISIKEGDYLVVNPLSDHICTRTSVGNIPPGLFKNVIIIFK
ncbi:hypothetical protein [Fowlpox virus]|nr:hypothetical protein [Fowlpox virus]